MGLLDSNRFLPVGSSVFTSNESVSLATVNSNLKTIPAKKGFRCVAIYVSVSAPTAVLSVRIGSSSQLKMMVTEDGEIHYRIDYYNNQSFIGGAQAKVYYVQVSGNEEIRLFNNVAVSGGTATITVTYLQDFPKHLESLKPRQILYRRSKTFGSGESTFNETLSTSLSSSETYMLLRYFKYLAVEMIFLNSSNTRKSVSGTFSLYACGYLPETTTTTSSPFWAPDFKIIDSALSNTRVYFSDWVEAKGFGLRYETSLGDTVSEGDKVIMNIIGIR